MKNLCLFLGLLLPGPAQDPDYAKLLKSATLSLGEALDRGAKEVAGGVPLTAYIEDNEGNPCFFVFVNKGKDTFQVAVDPKTGKVLEKETVPESDAKHDGSIVGALKITLAKAIETALGKVPGKAVYADFDLDEKGPVEAEVDVFADGKITRVFINGTTGEVLKTEAKK
jgi:uncharacterized membrane protein YkoI